MSLIFWDTTFEKLATSSIVLKTSWKWMQIVSRKGPSSKLPVTPRRDEDHLIAAILMNHLNLTTCAVLGYCETKMINFEKLLFIHVLSAFSLNRNSSEAFPTLLNLIYMELAQPYPMLIRMENFQSKKNAQQIGTISHRTNSFRVYLQQRYQRGYQQRLLWFSKTVKKFRLRGWRDFSQKPTSVRNVLFWARFLLNWLGWLVYSQTCSSAPTRLIKKKVTQQFNDFQSNWLFIIFKYQDPRFSHSKTSIFRELQNNSNSN